MDTDREYVWRSYDVEGGVVVNLGVRNYPFGTLPAERPVDFYIPSEHPELPQALADVHNEKDVLVFAQRFPEGT